MTNEGHIANGPYAGLRVIGKGSSYDTGGNAFRLGSPIAPEPFGTIVWRPGKGGFWEWIEREPTAVEAESCSK